MDSSSFDGCPKPTSPMSFEDSKIEDSTMRDDEEDDYDDDYDDDEFMANVNVYLNTREESPSNNKVLEGILRRSSSVRTKTVKFEDEFNDLQSDTSRSRQELLDQISRMTDMLRDAEAQVSLEREKRRKKDKYLLKLAKELKKRNAQQEVDKVRMEEVSDVKSSSHRSVITTLG